ncbi:MAG: hypothetical protein JWO72_84 [Caulobacteraceae bacterium]|jgi:hypothetical protein|nr:hypothetical protein [Caulobacteraceae bacterium]
MRNIFLASAAAATVFAGLGVNSAAFAQSGSYAGSCRNTQSSNGVLTAECADSSGRFHVSSIPYGQCRGDIGNNNGMLSCNGANATGGALVATDNNRGGNRGNNNGNVAGAAAAGVVAGALLGGALAGNNGPAIVYGDPHYGDPRYDSRYTQGGWGYGHRTGEWVPIRNRADWLDQRIARAQRDGRLSRVDARDLRRQLAMIEDQEARYQRDGRFDARERADLDRRFEALSQRISYEAAPGGDRRNGGDYRR